MDIVKTHRPHILTLARLRRDENPALPNGRANDTAAIPIPCRHGTNTLFASLRLSANTSRQLVNAVETPPARPLLTNDQPAGNEANRAFTEAAHENEPRLRCVSVVICMIS